jgi:hypothetical protein
VLAVKSAWMGPTLCPLSIISRSTALGPKATRDTLTAAPSLIQDSSDQAVKIAPDAPIHANRVRLAAADTVGGDQPSELHLVRLDHGAGLLEPLGHQIGAPRNPALVKGPQGGDIFVPQGRQELAPTQERRIADDHISSGPLRFAAIRVQDGIPPWMLSRLRRIGDLDRAKPWFNIH